MTVTPTEDDPEEQRRIARAIAEADRNLASALFAATEPLTYERALLSRRPETYDEHDRATLKRMAWHYRNRLPRWLRPKFNPDDPIIRERDQAHG